MRPNQPYLTPHRLLAIAWRRAPIVAVCVFVAVGAAVAYSATEQKQYTATASLLFNAVPLNQQIAGLQTNVNVNPQSQQDTNLQLVTLGNMAQVTAQKVGHGLTRSSVLNSLTVSPSGDTTVVTLSSTLPSPSLAARVVNTYARTFVREQQNSNHRYYESALATVERQIARLSPRLAKGVQGLELQDRAQSLATLAQIRSDTVSLAQPATSPTAPSSPSVRRNAIVAGILGLLLGLALIFGIERFDQNIREPSELEKTYALPLLGAVPMDSDLRLKGTEAREASSAVADVFQFIRARLRYFNVDRGLHTVAIVSSQPGDGKTTVACWLANAATRMGTRVLLVEADLRRPTIAQVMGLKSGPGLVDILIGTRAFDEATQPVRLAGSAENERWLDVIVAGALPPNPAEMLESQAMSDLLQRARSTYDFVVIDTPPLGAVSDAMPLVRAVDGVVIVAQMGKARRDAAERLKATLTAVNAPLLGVIANRVRGRGNAYDYGYSYTTSSSSPAGGSSKSHSPDTVASEAHTPNIN